MPQEILLNASLVTQEFYTKMYEFVVNEALYVTECVYVESLAKEVLQPVANFKVKLQSALFELNHVRVNPRESNDRIINNLTTSLRDIGVRVSNPPDPRSISSCYKPIGEISDNVRFYFQESGKLIFLSPAVKPKLVAMGGDLS